MYTSNIIEISEPRFPLGQVVCTISVQQEIPHSFMGACLQRHVQADWGDLCDEDKEENDQALKDGFRLLSVYNAPNGTRFYIITEHDRSVTTVLLTSEY